MAKFRKYDKSPHQYNAWFGRTDANMVKMNIHLPLRESTEPIIGVRGWRVSKNGLLQSVTVSYEWEGPVYRAEGKPTSLKPPVTMTPEEKKTLVHGVYAYSKKVWKRSLAFPVVGILEMSGTVVVHEEGYRAERATIRMLFTKRQGLIEKLESIYQCEVTNDRAKFTYYLGEL